MTAPDTFTAHNKTLDKGRRPDMVRMHVVPLGQLRNRRILPQRLKRYFRLERPSNFLRDFVIVRSIRADRAGQFTLKSAAGVRRHPCRFGFCAPALHDVSARRGGGRVSLPLRKAWKARDRIARHV